MRTPVSRYHRHRLPAGIISHCVWSYFRFGLSFRDVEEMLAMRGVSLAMRLSENGALSLGRLRPTACAASLLDPATGGILTKCFLKINGRIHYLWRAVDQDGDVLDILVQSQRNMKEAKKFFRKLLKSFRYVPRVIITDKPKSYGCI